MAQRRSLSGRSPFCQRTQVIKSQCHFRNYNISVKATTVKTANYQTPTSLQSPRECRGVVMQPVPRIVKSRASWQRREHACQPSEGEGTLVPRVWRCCTVVLKHDRLSRVCDEDAQPFNLVQIGWHIILNL